MNALQIPGIVWSGVGAMERLGELCAGHAVMIFSDPGIARSGLVDQAMKYIQPVASAVFLDTALVAEPTYTQAQAVVDRYRNSGADTIVAIGGGSVMDSAKLCAILADGQYSVHDLLENPALGRKQARTIMIPTTAGTGAEATPNAIVSVPEQELKVGIVNAQMIPDAVILDGETLRKLPASIAAATGVDALCHAIECYTSKKANAFSNLFAMEALKLIFAHLESACLDETALESKNAMLLAAFYAGVAITCSGTTAVHALSYPLGGKYHIPHGIANAMMLMPVMHFNRQACLEQFAQVSDAVGGPAGDANAKADWLLESMDRLVRRLRIPTGLERYGISLADVDGLVAAGMQVQRLLINNQRTVTPEDARALYLELFDRKECEEQ